MRRVAYILSIIYVIFLSIFAFDEIGNSFIGFLIHLIPSFLILITILITKRYQLIGGIMFGLLALATIIFFKTYQDIIVFILVSLPLLIVSLLTLKS